MKKSNPKGISFSEHMKAQTAKAVVQPIFALNSDKDRVLIKITMGETTFLIGDNKYDITPKVYATKAFKKDFGKRILAPSAHNNQQVWLNVPTAEAELASDW